MGEVSGDSDSADGISGSHPGLYCFQGFSCLEESREASLHWRRILVLHQSASVILAGVIRGAVLNDPTRSWGSPPYEVTPADSSASVGSDRSVSAGRVVTGNPRRSFLMARPRSLSAQRFSGAGVPSARVMVRRLGRGLGAHLDEQVASGLWAPEDVKRSINAQELLAIERALQWFAPLLAGSSVAVFADNSTAVLYLRNQGGTRSSFLNSIAQRILRWAEDLSVVIFPQFIMEKHNVLAVLFLAQTRSWAPSGR